MKPGGVATAGVLLLGAGTALWLAQPKHEAVAPGPQPKSRTPLAREGRVYLNGAQLEQALASKTLDRPVKSLLAVHGPLHFGEYQWNDRDVPDGALWIRIDLGAQLISVFRAGHEIGTSVIVYGGDNKQTPGGRLHILARDKDHRSSLYDADMPYTLQLTYDGVAIHGSDVRTGRATHGCVGVPLGFASRLFDAAKVGDEVVIIPVSARAPVTT
jgi:lipoprotein-anchoring transpeptidase ErfK/SrfK